VNCKRRLRNPAVLCWARLLATFVEIHLLRVHDAGGGIQCAEHRALTGLILGMSSVAMRLNRNETSRALAASSPHSAAHSDEFTAPATGFTFELSSEP